MKVYTNKIAGFIGDKIGFRVVLMIYVLLNLLLETSLTLIPVYQEHEQIGSHGVTFFSYLAIRTATEWARKSTFALLDGASLRYLKEDMLYMYELKKCECIPLW